MGYRPGHNRKAAKFAKPPPPSKKPSPPRHEPTNESRAAVAAMAATFLSQDLMAIQLGIDKRTLLKYYRSEIDTAIERANATVVSRLHGHTAKHPVACFFWLQNRDADHWKHANVLKHQHDATGKMGSLADLVMASYRQPAAPGDPAKPAAPPTGPTFDEGKKTK